MASDLSSTCTEVNELFNDEKEEGEISLEDVSSSEEGQPYKYPPRAFGQCPYCLSTQHCATWCKSLTINKNNIKPEAHPVVAEDAGLQGKENRSRRHYHKDITDIRASADPTGPKSISYSTLQEKNKNDGTAIINDLVPISSDSDMELVGLGHETKSEKRSRRPLKSSKARRRRRNKSPSVTSLSLSPSSIDIALSVKKSIHRLEPPSLPSRKKEIIRSKCYHRSPAKKKLINNKPPLSIHRRNRSRCSPILPKRRNRRQVPPPQSSRKASPSRQRVTGTSSNTAEDLQPSVRGNVTKLLKKVRRLEPFSSRSREKGSSLKDKLSNIIKNKKETTSTTVITTSNTCSTTVTSTTTTTTQSNTTTNSVITCAKETNKNNLAKSITKEDPIVTVKSKNDVVVTHNVEVVTKKNKNKDKDEDEDLLVLRQKALETKQKKGAVPRPEDAKKESCCSVQTQPQTATNLQKLPNSRPDENEDDLELRMIALRSAVLKKHHTRMQSGIKRKKKSETPVVPRIESPFTSSFIEDFPLLAKICSPTSPLGSKKDIYYDEDMDLDSDMELDGSPYSPSDDVGNGFLGDGVKTSGTVTNQEHVVNLSPYSSSKPVEISCHRDLPLIPVEGNVMRFPIHESRPYSPTDITIYDPDLPGMCFSSTEAQPLQPPPLPPLPPLGMLGSQQPIILGCTMNLANTYTDPLLTLPISNFSSIHQALNPLLLPPPPPPPPPPLSTTPLFAGSVSTTVTTTTITTMTTATTTATTNESAILPFESITINELDDFGQTDLDGSPLVSIEQDNERTTWSLGDETLYLHNVKKSEPSGLPKLIESTPINEPELETIESMSKNVINGIVQPILLSTLRGKESDEQRVKKVSPIERKRKRRQSSVLRTIKETVNCKLNVPLEKCQEVSSRNLKEKNPKDGETSIEDDEETLREILLASLAKRVKDQSVEICSNKSESNIPKQKDNISSSATPSTKLTFAKTGINQLKRPALQTALTEQPLRKIVKKMSIIPASTKVVNNAKRYQNLLIQRKLNQQKISLLTSLKSRFKLNNNSSNNNSINKSTGNISEIQRSSSSSPQVMKSIADSQRIIINLNEDTESESDTEEARMKLDSVKARPTLTIPTTDFEKSVDQFLKNVRQQQEMTLMATTTTGTATTTTTTTATIMKMITNGANVSQLKPAQKLLATVTTTPAALTTKISTSVASKSKVILTKPSTVTTDSTITIPATSLGNDKIAVDKPKIAKPTMKIPSMTATPQAVKHLSVSQQEEYRRLKQQIFEREKLRLQKSKESSSLTSSTTPSMTKKISVSLSSPLVSLSSPLTSSTPKIGSKTRIRASSSLVSPLSKIAPKTQLVATISPMSKQSLGNVTAKAANHNSITPINPKPVINKPGVISKAPVQTNSRPSIIRLQQVTLLDKMNDALNTQKNQIRAVVDKVSTLRTLTKEQLDLKSSQIQRTIVESENRILTDNCQAKDMKINCKVSANASDSSKNISTTSTSVLLPVSVRNNVEPSLAKENTPNVDPSKQNWEEFKKVVNEEVKSLLNISAEEKRELLSKTEEELITKRHSVLDDITEMSGNLRQWEIERDLQNMLSTEISKLREQLRIAEEKLQQQKEKLNTIQPKVSVYHEKINNGRKECFRLSKICNSLGQQIMGSNYNVPTAGAELLNNKIKEVASHTEKLRSKKNQTKEIIKSNNLIKSDKTKFKSNSKRKEFIKKQVLIATKNNGSKNKTNSKNTNLNPDNINTEIKTQLLESRVRKPNFVTTNINYTQNKEPLAEVNLENSILNMENNFGIKTNKSLTSSNALNAVLKKVNILKHKLKNHLSEFNDLNANLKTKNVVNSESEKTLKSNLINSNLSRENINIDNDKLLTQNTIFKKIVNADNLQETENNLINRDILHPNLTLKSTISTETVKQKIGINATNLSVNIKDAINSKLEKQLIDSNKKSDVIKKNISKIENENSLRVNSVEDQTLIEKNVNSIDLNINSVNKLLAEYSDKELVSNKKNIVNIESEKLATEISVDGIILTEQNGNNSKKLVNETSASRNDIIEESNPTTEPREILKIGLVDSISTTLSIDNESNESLINTNTEKTNTEKTNSRNDSELIITTAHFDTENIENNSNINNDKNIGNKIMNVLVHETAANTPKISQTKASKSSTSIKHSTLLDEINQKTSEKINEPELPLEQQNIEHLSANTNASLLQDCSNKAFGKTVIRPYESILKHLHLTRNTKTDGILCPFELMGTCNDGDCQFVHQSTSHCR